MQAWRENLQEMDEKELNLKKQYLTTVLKEPNFFEFKD